VRVLPNTVDPRFTPGLKPADMLRRFGLEGRKVILTVSRLASGERYKGHDRIIASMPHILERHPEALYLVAGDGDDRPRLEALAQSAGLGDKIRFAGSLTEADLPGAYRMADVFAMPSTGEGFGIVFLEAAASGLPVIAGNRDGSVDALADGAIGQLVDPDQPDQLVSAIGAALDGRCQVDPLAVSRLAFNAFSSQVAELVRSLH